MRALKNGGASGGGGGGGGVSSVAVATANGFKGTVTNPTSSASIAIKTSITGLLRGNGTAIAAATVVDADVDAAAAIDGSKIVPTFGTQSISGKSLTLTPISTSTRDAISSPATGLVIYNSTTTQLEVWNGDAWVGFDNTPVTLAYASTINPPAETPYQVVTCTGNLTIDTPGGGRDGSRIKLRVIASGGGNNLSFTGITIPSDSSFTNPKALTASKMYVILLEKYSGAWILESLIGGY